MLSVKTLQHQLLQLQLTDHHQCVQVYSPQGSLCIDASGEASFFLAILPAAACRLETVTQAKPLPTS